MEPREELLELLRAHAVIRGPVTLASGRQSNVYIDCRRRVLIDGTLLPLIGETVWDMVKDWDVQAIGGPETAAIPIALFTVAHSRRLGGRTCGFWVRRKAKAHGPNARSRIEGPMKPDWRAVLVDDVLTTGGSLLDAAAVVRGADVEVAGAVVLVDRQEGGRERLEAAGVPVRAVFTVGELVEEE
jgi:orotate phosphoribosyltransferase